MQRVGYLTASCMIAGSPDERGDSWEHALEMQALVPACREAGIRLEELVWNAADWSAAEFDAFVIGTTWDYQEQADAFLERLAELEQIAPLLNPLATVRWNLDKRYLADMQQRGVRVVPTRWIEVVTQGEIDAALHAWDADAVVVKPVVGAGAWRQAKVRRGEALPDASELPPGEAMVQPFLDAVREEGEYSFLFFDRSFSHCLQKCPKPGDYRVQALYGGVESVFTPGPEELAVAQAAIDAIHGELLYARVDLMRLASGELALMELELIEPYFYPEQGPQCGERFAAGLLQQLQRA